MNMLEKVTTTNIVLENEFPRSENTQVFTGAEVKALISKPICNDVLESKPKGSSKTETNWRRRQGSSWTTNHTLGT